MAVEKMLIFARMSSIMERYKSMKPERSLASKIFTVGIITAIEYPLETQWDIFTSTLLECMERSTDVDAARLERAARMFVAYLGSEGEKYRNVIAELNQALAEYEGESFYKTQSKDQQARDAYIAQIGALKQELATLKAESILSGKHFEREMRTQKEAYDVLLAAEIKRRETCEIEIAKLEKKIENYSFDAGKSDSQVRTLVALNKTLTGKLQDNAGDMLKLMTSAVTAHPELMSELMPVLMLASTVQATAGILEADDGPDEASGSGVSEAQKQADIAKPNTAPK